MRADSRSTGSHVFAFSPRGGGPNFDLRTSYVNDRPDVSVIIGTCQGAGTIAATLRSLAAQTLPPDRFEVIVVQNGPRDATAKVVDQVRGEYPHLRLRRMEYRLGGAGRARNAGMAMGRGEYVTYVDDDDTVSPTYLESLLRCSGPDTVGVAHLADFCEDGSVPDFDNRLASQLVLAGQTVSPGQAISVMTYTVGKMMPMTMARAVGFDPDLRSGEDIVFYLRFFLANQVRVRFVPLEDHAVYYRAVVAGSLSRQGLSYDFNVTQRLDVIERLEALQPTEVWQRTAIRERTKSQARAINRFLREHPEQQVRVWQDIRDRALTTVPVETTTAGLVPLPLWTTPADARRDPAETLGGRRRAEVAITGAG